MSDHTLADDIAAILREEAAPLIAEAFHADRYEVVRLERVPDGRGGWNEIPGVVETGRCKLTAANRQGAIRLQGDVVLPVAPYSADLPRGSVLTVSDRLRINGRTFNVTSPPKLAGDAGMFLVAELEES